MEALFSHEYVSVNWIGSFSGESFTPGFLLFRTPFLVIIQLILLLIGGFEREANHTFVRIIFASGSSGIIFVNLIAAARVPS